MLRSLVSLLFAPRVEKGYHPKEEHNGEQKHKNPNCNFCTTCKSPLLEDSEPENVGLVVVGDGTDELLALVEEIVELPEEVFALVDEVVVLDDGVVVVVDGDSHSQEREDFRVAGLTGYEIGFT